MKLTHSVATLARVIVNCETTETYTEVFMHLFSTIIERKLDLRVRWRCIHGDGLVAVVMDQDSKQWAGQLNRDGRGYDR